GKEITLDQAEAPLLVERGDNVVIRVAQGGIQASMRGVALQSGSLGEGILVRNLSSDKEITAWVVENGIVESRFQGLSAALRALPKPLHVFTGVIARIFCVFCRAGWQTWGKGRKALKFSGKQVALT